MPRSSTLPGDIPVLEQPPCPPPKAKAVVTVKDWGHSGDTGGSPLELTWKAPPAVTEVTAPQSTMQPPPPPPPPPLPTTQGLDLGQKIAGVPVPPWLHRKKGARKYGQPNLRGHGDQRKEDGVHITEEKTKEAADAQEFWKASSPASSTKALAQSGHVDERKVTLNYPPEIIRIKAENQTPSDECQQFTASMSKEFTQWLHAWPVNDPTADSDPSEGSKGSEASQATVSGDSSKSPEISVVEWPPAVAEKLGEAMITGDEAQKEEFEKVLQKGKVCFLKERKRGPHIAWKMESRREKRLGIRRGSRRRLR